jgi:hypothetical protein
MNTQHERQRTYNVTPRGVRVAVLPRERGRVRACNLTYTACKTHAPYYIVWLNQIFPHYLRNGTIIGVKLRNIRMCFNFLYNFISNISHSKKNSERYCLKRENVFM